MTELPNENKEQGRERQQQPAVGPDPSFSQKVLSSFEREPMTSEEIKKKQRKWKKYTDTKNEPPKANDFSSLFLCRLFDPNVCLLDRSFVYRSYYTFNTWYCQKSRLAEFFRFVFESLWIHGITHLFSVFCFIDETQSWPNDWENDLRYSSHQL